LHGGFLGIPKNAFEKCGGKKGVKIEKAGKKASGAYRRRKQGRAS
jgi:hypothetical protein